MTFEDGAEGVFLLIASANRGVGFKMYGSCPEDNERWFLKHCSSSVMPQKVDLGTSKGSRLCTLKVNLGTSKMDLGASKVSLGTSKVNLGKPNKLWTKLVVVDHSA
ncbi:hypothetical protein NPIL_188111 [Nephila pilipes]|uniref:Uncharacterized protein n=1 Tax=Nephila pilipes TaxID=299642 RepID=A0A8X6UWT8_NEPPI|nr:hypothetical protein NPIL_188111 [Nephila pilipes]